MNENKDNVEEPKIVIKNNADLQRLKLSKLMKNPNKPVIIPERPKDKGVPIVPDFVRNVMGSSAGAGSGEFHVYRHLRRKEYARQKFMQEKAERERLDDEYRNKLEENKKLAAKRTEKKRLKRLKKKKNKSKKTEKLDKPSSSSDNSDSEQEEKEIPMESEEVKQIDSSSENTEMQDHDTEEVKQIDSGCENTEMQDHDIEEIEQNKGCNTKNANEIIEQDTTITSLL